MENSRDQQKFFDFIERQVKSTQRQILDLTEIAVPADSWRVMRSKILGITNDLRRNLEDEVINNYNIKFDPSTICEDIIEVKKIKLGFKD